MGHLLGAVHDRVGDVLDTVYGVPGVSTAHHRGEPMVEQFAERRGNVQEADQDGAGGRPAGGRS